MVFFTSQVLDTGITILANLLSNTHIIKIWAKALRRSCALSRSFASHSLRLMSKAFITYIKPLLKRNRILSSSI